MLIHLAALCCLTEQVAGVDEVGRGPLVGPVVAAAVVLDPQKPIAELNDSKKLSRATRERLAQRIRQDALAYAIAAASVAEVDHQNILQASLLAMSRATQQLNVKPSLVLVDGNRLPKLVQPALSLVKGDARIAAISAASIIAKVARDRWMSKLAVRYPGYGFEQHAGYGTKAHLAALQRLGPCPAHRRSFAPVRQLLESQGQAA